MRGIQARGDVGELGAAQLRRCLEVNVVGTFLACQAAVPFMRAAGYGRIVTLASALGLVGAAGGHDIAPTPPTGMCAIIPTGKRKGQNPSVARIYRALAEHAKREAYPEVVEQARADFAALTGGEVPEPRTEIKALTTR
ncbi:SDR family NAD(P)-dependent oxidoreductase [Nonomuraea sp. NPDC005692]|uniref:SDR family NAD(P)-dependent oxidoreductase n=1 Tax=Nonomuraea sp. NPDC005692 TaxID=3157168 RepID=UPI0033EB7871